MSRLLYSSRSTVPISDRFAVLDVLRIHGPMPSVTIREHMHTAGWGLERTNRAIRYLHKAEAIRKVGLSDKHKVIWGMV